MSGFDLSPAIAIRGTRDSVDNLARTARLLQQQLREVNEQLDSITQALMAMSAFNFATPVLSRGTSDPVDSVANAARLLQEELSRAAVPASHVQSLLSSMPSPVGMLDLRGRVVQQNRAMERLLKTNTSGDFMVWLNECLPPERQLDISEWRDPVQLAYRVGEIELHYLFFVAPLVSHSDDTEGYVVVGIDMTQQVWIEKELARAKEIAESHARARFSFVTNMSHEIRTPLHGILGSTELLLGSLTSLDAGEVERHAKTIQTCGQHLLTLVSDIMDFSHIDGNRIKLDQRPFDLPSLLQECMESAKRSQSGVQQEGVITRITLPSVPQPTQEISGVATRVTINSDVPRYLSGDSKRLKQVITNLLSNALKFTFQGMVELRALLAEQKDDHARIRFEIIDTGIGIPEDKQAQLFDPFEQADVSSTRAYGGTGLGLAIVRGLIEIMQGHMGVLSKPGEGSNFWFEITLPVAGGAVDVGREEEQGFDEGRIRGARILLVEDNLVSRRIAQRMLQKVGCEVTVAGHGAEALERAAEAQFDIILMDCQMPVMDGITATRELRKREYQTPVIALTADAHEDSRRRCIEAGMDDYLHKPVGKDSLCRAIDRYLRKTA